MRMEEQTQAQEELNFNILIKEVMDVFKKHNPPLEVAVSSVFFVISEVAQNLNVPKEGLTNRLSEVYDMVAEMRQKAQQAKKENQDEIQH